MRTTRLLSLLIIGLFVLSTGAMAYEVGPTMIKGSLGAPIIAKQIQEREAHYRSNCYFTSEGAVCPLLTSVATNKVQRVSPTKIPEEKMAEATMKKEETMANTVAETPSRVTTVSPASMSTRTRVVTSIHGKPGAFSRWASKQRNYANLCYYGSGSTGQGNLICPSFVSDQA